MKEEKKEKMSIVTLGDIATNDWRYKPFLLWDVLEYLLMDYFNAIYNVEELEEVAKTTDNEDDWCKYFMARDTAWKSVQNLWEHIILGIVPEGDYDKTHEIIDKFNPCKCDFSKLTVEELVAIAKGEKECDHGACEQECDHSE